MKLANRYNNDPTHAKPRCLRGFDEINRYWDKLNLCYAAKILPGEYYVTKHEERITTVLGSCVSACIRDTVTKIGGMNHFMLPMTLEDEQTVISKVGNAARYGNFAMEQLINTILSNGGSRKNLEVKLFGGGRVLAGMSKIDIGEKNIAFIRGYVLLEQLNVIAHDLGDVYPRKVIYSPKTGKVWMKKLLSRHNNTVALREKRYKVEIEHVPVESDIELFD